MSNNPDQIRHEIESTRAELSGDVNALADSVRPSTVARRQVDKVRDGVTTVKNSVKDSVMGTADDAGQAAARQVAENLKEPAREAVEQVKASAADSAATVKDEASSTAAGVKDSTRQAAEEVGRQS